MGEKSPARAGHAPELICITGAVAKGKLLFSPGSSRASEKFYAHTWPDSLLNGSVTLISLSHPIPLFIQFGPNQNPADDRQPETGGATTAENAAE